MAIIRITAEWEHERVLREVANVQSLRRVMAAAENRSDLVWIETIDPYGDTVFNRMQIPKFLEEWMILSSEASTDIERRTMDDVRALAEFCLEKPHRYLRFCGD
jgi:hypothetical protein